MQKPKKLRTTFTASQAAEPVAFEEVSDGQEETAVHHHSDDHIYALPSGHDQLKAKLVAAESRVEQLQRELRNAKAREKRSKKTLQSMFEELKEKNLVNEELEQKLDLYAGMTVCI